MQSRVSAPFPTPLRGVGFQIHFLQIIWYVDALLRHCVAIE